MQKIIIAISLLFVLIVGYLWKGEPDVKKNTIKTTTHIKHVETEETRKTIIEEQIEHNNPNSDFKSTSNAFVSFVLLNILYVFGLFSFEILNL